MSGVFLAQGLPRPSVVQRLDSRYTEATRCMSSRSDMDGRVLRRTSTQKVSSSFALVRQRGLFNRYIAWTYHNMPLFLDTFRLSFPSILESWLSDVYSARQDFSNTLDVCRDRRKSMWSTSRSCQKSTRPGCMCPSIPSTTTTMRCHRASWTERIMTSLVSMLRTHAICHVLALRNHVALCIMHGLLSTQKALHACG